MTSHINESGEANMVDISEKKATKRVATAKGVVLLKKSTLRAIEKGKTVKGSVFGAARLAGIMAAKRTSDLIPLCHPLTLAKIEINFEVDKDKSAILIESIVKNNGKTGVEMEALIGVSVAGLTIYDMLKSIDKGIEISEIHLSKKQGGKTGLFVSSKSKKS